MTGPLARFLVGLRGQGSSHPRHVSHARAAQPVPAHSSSRKPASAHSSSGRVSRFAPGTSVSADVSQQVMVADRTSGTHGTWARYQWRGSAKGWVKVSSSGVGSVSGHGGVVPSGRRRQGTRTTPAGTFGVVSAFGVGNPGTKLSYRTIGRCSWWIEDPSQRGYNRWREDCSHLSTSDNERLADYAGSLYRQAAVLSYNYASPTRYGAGSGAGIFLHYATRYTGGCVAVNSHIWASTSTPTTMTRPRPFSQLICPRASVIRRPSHAGQSSSLAS